MLYEIVNSAGKKVEINFTPAEAQRIKYLQQVCNDLGYEIPITTLTAISKNIVEQKFYDIPPAEYLPVRVGEGAWSSDILTYRSYAMTDDFEGGLINTGGQQDRLTSADAGVDSITVPVKNWARQIEWTIFDLQQAAKAGNWDIVSSKEYARKKAWDLGIQRTAFLGLKNNSAVKGLLTQSDVTANTGLITGYIKSMNETQFEAFIEGVMEAYRANAQRTARPTHFIIPEADFNGLTVATSENFPLKSKIQRLEESFKTITMNPNFKILPLAYADQSNNADVSGLNKNRYTLLNYDENSIRMDIPVDYTNTMANSINNFQFQNVGYGQFTGAKAYRPREMLYLDFAV